MSQARVGVVLTLVALAVGAGLYAQTGARTDVEAAAMQAPTPQALSSSGMALPDFRQIVRSNRDAVVQIAVRGEDRSLQEQFGEDSPLGEFFRRFGVPGQPGEGGGQAPERRGSGSGFIIGANGRILTNAHVVKDADEIVVTLSDNREFKAKVLGADERTDVALIEIEAKGLPVVRLGNSDQLEVGEWVLAIGAPFGMSYTATQGIVSATERQLRETYVPFIQTDAAVNPGNSGGPLFNARGEVIGINSQILSGSGGYMGLSFAIPINTANLIAKQLADKGFVERGYLGIQFQAVTGAHARASGLDRPPGALPSSKARFAANPHVSGAGGGHDLNLHQFARDGITLLGHLRGAAAGRITLAADLHESLAKSDQIEAQLLTAIDGYISRTGLDSSGEVLPVLRDGFEQPEIAELDVETAGISSVIWAVGYQFDFGMVKLPVTDGDGFPVQERGVTAYPGLYFVGLPWLHTQKSGLLAGVGEDAAFVATHIARKAVVI